MNMLEAIKTPPAGGDHNNGFASLGMGLARTVVATLCVLLRNYIRLYVTHNFEWDDALIVLAWVKRPVST